MWPFNEVKVNQALVWGEKLNGLAHMKKQQKKNRLDHTKTKRKKKGKSEIGLCYDWVSYHSHLIQSLYPKFIVQIKKNVCAFVQIFIQDQQKYVESIHCEQMIYYKRESR